MVGSKVRTLLVLGAMCFLAPFAMAETPRYLDYCCSEITPPPANYGRSGFKGVIVDPDSTDPACYKTISSALGAVHSNGTIWVKPNNRKTLIENLVIRKPVKIKRYIKSDVAAAGGTRQCRTVPGLGKEYTDELQAEIAKLERTKSTIRDEEEIKSFDEMIAGLQSDIENVNQFAFYRIQPVSGDYCARVSLKNWKGTVEISGAKFVPPPVGEKRTKDCIVQTAGNLTVTGSSFSGSTSSLFSGMANYRAIVINDGSATIVGNEIESLKTGIVVNHKPNIYNNKVSTTPADRKILIADNWITGTTENAIAVLAPVPTVIKNNKLIFSSGKAPVGRKAFAGITTYGYGPICGNWIDSHPIGIVHYGSGEIRDNVVIENGTGISLRIDNQKPDEKFRLYDNKIAGNRKVGLATPRGAIQEHDAGYITALYEQGREEEIYKTQRGDSTYFNGNQFCNRKNVFRMKDLPPGARGANMFKGGRGWERRCDIRPIAFAPPVCSATAY